METSFYETPSTTVMYVKFEGIICASDIKGSNSINNWGDGGTTNDEVFM